MKLDFIKLSEKFPSVIRLQALSRVLDIAIPFNFGLRFKIAKLAPELVQMEAPVTRRRKNHVGGAHACFLALLSEYPAGLLLAQKYSFEKYRMIISGLKIQYEKQGHGRLFSEVKAPGEWPEMKNGECFIDLETEIKNQKGERVSLCQTRWQIKDWTQVRTKKRETK